MSDDHRPARLMLGTDERGTDVYGARNWAGGLLLVDAFRPDRPHRLHLGGDELLTTLGIRLREQRAAGALDPGAVELPAPWVREAVVDAVDRWVDRPLDAGLLLADRALAAAESDDDASAVDLYRRARQGLADLVRRLDAAHDKPEALLVEVVRVLLAAPDDYGVRRPRTSGEASIGDAFAALESEDRHRRSRVAAYLTKGEDGTGGEARVGQVPVLRHPLLVPARLLSGPPVATESGERIDVVATAAGGVDPTVVAGRLLLTAMDAQTLRAVSVAPFLFDDGTFHATLRPAASGARSTLVVLHDAVASVTPILTPAELARAASLTALQTAYGAERLMAAHRALDDAASEALAQQDRVRALTAPGLSLPPWLDLAEAATLAPRLEDACRPLLAELALAHT